MVAGHGKQVAGALSTTPECGLAAQGSPAPGDLNRKSAARTSVDAIDRPTRFAVGFIGDVHFAGMRQVATKNHALARALWDTKVVGG